MSLNVLKVNSSPPNAIVSFNCFLMHSLGCNIAAKQTLCCIRFISIILEYLMLFLSLCVCVCIHDRLLLFFFYRCILMSTAVETVMCESLIKRLEVRSHSLPSDQEGDVGADGSEPWINRLAEGLCPAQIHLSIDWVNTCWSVFSSLALRWAVSTQRATSAAMSGH